MEGSPGLWKFTTTINFAGQNVVDQLTDMKLGAVAYSEYGVPSNVHNVSYRVANRVVAPMTRWQEIYHITYGEESSIDLSIYDPRGEGIITTDFEAACKKYIKRRYSCACKSSPKQRGVLRCKITVHYFKPKGPIQFIYSATNTNPNDKTDFATSSFKTNIVSER